MRSRSKSLHFKSVSAMVAAIEVYNKPSFPYREETFAILATNAWELMLKARILMLDGNRMAAILEYEKRRNKDGEWSTKLYRKKGKSGVHLSVGLFTAYDLLQKKYGDVVPLAVRENLELLVAIRDASVHFMNQGSELSKRVLEIGTGSLRNYVALSRRWFGDDLSKYNFYLMPLAFVSEVNSVEALNLNSEEVALANYLEAKMEDATTSEDGFSVSIQMEVTLKRGAGQDGPLVVLSNSPDAIPVALEEADFRERFPWDYGVLTKRLSARYSDFIINHNYHGKRKDLQANQKYGNERLLDPGNPKSLKKWFFSPAILNEFDNVYTRKQKA